MDSVEVYAERIVEEFQHTDYRELEVMAADIEKAARTQYGDDLELYLFNSAGAKVYGGESVQNNLKLDNIANRTKIYPFTLDGSPEEYSFFFMDSTQAVNQALEAINQVFPYLIITIFIISILTAFFSQNISLYLYLKSTKPHKK